MVVAATCRLLEAEATIGPAVDDLEELSTFKADLALATIPLVRAEEAFTCKEQKNFDP